MKHPIMPFRLEPEIVEQIDAIKEKIGAPSRAEVVRRAIGIYHKGLRLGKKSKKSAKKT